MIDGRRRLLRLGLAGIALAGLSRASGVAAQTGAKVGGSLEVHALDATIGKPAEGIAVELFLVSTEPASKVGQKTTNADGHAILIAGDALKVGRYELRFAVGTVCGLIFGGTVGLKVASELGLGQLLGSHETVLMGSAVASLCAWWALGFELAGVLLVGTLSLVLPTWFAHDSVWSYFGSGYLFIPLVLPVLGMVWLRRDAAYAESQSSEAVRGSLDADESLY